MKLSRKAIIVLALAFCTSAVLIPGGPVLAADGEKPDYFFHTLVDADFVAQHIQYPMPENVMLIDARPKRSKYDKGHIPMAVSIPDMDFDKHVDKLPADKEALLIYYCEGHKCKLSHESARKAEALGYKNVKVYAEGFPGWMEIPGHFAGVSVDWVKSQMDKNEDMMLVDSRPKRSKYDKGHISGAVSIPDTDFDKMTDQLPAEKDRLMVFYCGGFNCKLSHKSAAKALAMGYSNVKVFAGGYPEWKERFGDATAAEAAGKSETTVKAGKEEGSIDIASFEAVMKEKPESLYLVDVRDADEYAKGSLKTAVNIPVDQLEERIKELPGDKPIVFVCGTGARSGESFYMVQDLRPELKDVYYVEGEMTFKADGTFKVIPPKS